MEDLLNLIYVEGDIIATSCRIFIFGFALDFVLGFANILKSGYSTVRKG